MNRNCIKLAVALALFATAVIAQNPAPTPTATPFVAPPLPRIVEFDRPSVMSFSNRITFIPACFKYPERLAS